MDLQKLKFDKLKYGKELLIDTVDMEEFDPGGAVALPNFYVMGCLKKANGKIQINDQVLGLDNYTFLFIRPGAITNMEDSNFEEATWIFFEGEFLDFFFDDQFFTYKFDFFHGVNTQKSLHLTSSQFEVLYNLAREIHEEIRDLKFDSVDLLRSSLYLLLIKLNRYYGKDHKTHGTLISDMRVLKLKHLLENRIRILHTVEEYAKALEISKTYLNKLSQQFFGRTSKQLITDRLILECKQEILFTQKDIAEIAYDLNFSDPANFNRFFKKATSLTPAKYRAEFSK